jgi:hypothetical protein
MNPPDDSPEITSLESNGILIKDQLYRAVLTNRRIIFTGYSDQKSRSIVQRDIQRIELDTDAAGDPVLIIFTSTVLGEMKKVILHFSKKNFPDPLPVRSLWYTEINMNLQPATSVSPPTIPITPTTPKIPVTTPTKPPVTQAFCVRCGSKFTDGSVFCNKCGIKIIYPAQPLPPDQIDTRVRDSVKIPEVPLKKIDQPPKEIQQEISTEKNELTPKEIQKTTPFSAPVVSDTTENVLVPATPSPEPEPSGIVSSSTNFPSRKTAVYGISALVGIIVFITIFFIVLPSASNGFDLTSLGMNSTTPEVKDSASTFSPDVSLITTPKPTYAPEIPEQQPVTVVPFSQPAFTPVPGDPASVLESYPSLFNSGNTAGLADISSENLKSYSPIVNSELAVARSNGITIDKIQVNNQSIEGNDAILDVDILWKVAGSQVTSSPRFFLVYEGNQWKLDTLILSPDIN